MGSALEVLSRSPVRRAAVAVLLALAVALVIAVASGSGTSTASGRLGGDYPEFYGAGRILLDGDIDQLYDVAARRDRRPSTPALRVASSSSDTHLTSQPPTSHLPPFHTA